MAVVAQRFHQQRMGSGLLKEAFRCGLHLAPMLHRGYSVSTQRGSGWLLPANPFLHHIMIRYQVLLHDP